MGKIAFMFAGQGSQYVGMGKDLYEKEPVAREVFLMGERLRPGTLSQCFASDITTLTETENTQPCLFLMDLACARALEAHGIEADAVAGFSLGELAAVAYAGILTDEEAFRLVMLRGQKMADCAKAHPGAMLAVLKLSADEIVSISRKYKDVYAVNFNCKEQTVVAGDPAQLAAFSEAIKAAGGRLIPLKVSGAFHTPYMEEASKALLLELQAISMMPPKHILYANVTGEPYPCGEREMRETLASQAKSPVQWERTLRHMEQGGVTTYVEVGAGKTLTGLASKTLTGHKSYNVSDMESLRQTVAELENRD